MKSLNISLLLIFFFFWLRQHRLSLVWFVPFTTSVRHFQFFLTRMFTKINWITEFGMFSDLIKNSNRRLFSFRIIYHKDFSFFFSLFLLFRKDFCLFNFITIISLSNFLALVSFGHLVIYSTESCIWFLIRNSALINLRFVDLNFDHWLLNLNGIRIFWIFCLTLMSILLLSLLWMAISWINC